MVGLEGVEGSEALAELVEAVAPDLLEYNGGEFAVVYFLT